jgi:hypothetical protein
MSDVRGVDEEEAVLEKASSFRIVS